MRNRVVFLAIGFLAIVAGIVVPQTSAAAGTIPYVIQTVNGTSKCIDVPNGTFEDDPVIMYTCAYPRHANQQWYLRDTSDGYANIWNRQTGKCLTVQNASTANNATVIQYSCNTGDNEEWAEYRDHSGIIRFVNRKSQRCLTIKYASTANGALLVQYDCNDGSNENWELNL
jgi:ricin-type beta-trefoil lectin protein